MRALFKSLCLAGALMLFAIAQAQKIAPELREYVYRFSNEVSSRGILFTANIKAIKFPDSADYQLHQFNMRNPNWAGVAVRNNYTNQYIVYLNRQSFDKSDETGKEMLVFHELIHAYFSMLHFKGNCLMHELNLTNSDALYYKENRKQVLDEVFTHYKSLMK